MMSFIVVLVVSLSARAHYAYCMLNSRMSFARISL